MSKGAGGYSGGGSRAAPAGGYAGGRRAPTAIANAGGYTGGTSRLPPGRRAPTAIANAGGYDGGRGKPQKGYANLGGQNNTNLTSRTLSQTITQHPDGAVSQTTALTETYSFEMNTSTPTEGFNAMPYGPIRTAPPQGCL